MHQTKKGNHWHFGMKAHIGVDADSGSVHTVIVTAANANDVAQGHSLLHGRETVVFANAGYQSATDRPEATGVQWHVAMRPGKRKQQKSTPWGHLTEQAEKLKASVRENARKQPQRTDITSEPDDIATAVSSCEQCALNSRFGGGGADLP